MKIITDENDGGTVGSGETPTLAEESRRRAKCRSLITARIALDTATKAGIAARVHFDALRAQLEREGFAPTEAEMQSAYREMVGGGAPPTAG